MSWVQPSFKAVGMELGASISHKQVKLVEKLSVLVDKIKFNDKMVIQSNQVDKKKKRLIIACEIEWTCDESLKAQR